MPASAAPNRSEVLVIAIDGPSGSGKSSVSREVARQLGLEYLDTGAMYRAVCWSCMEHRIDLADPDAVARHARALVLKVGTDPRSPYVRVDGIDVTEQIRDPRISAAVSAVATNLEVRAELKRRQRALIETAKAGPCRGVVAEGRDITTVVAPDADVRLLLTASERARIERRALEALGSADDGALAATHDLVVRRDADDSTVSSFFTAADGVLSLDSSRLTFDQTVDAVMDAVAAAAPQWVRAVDLVDSAGSGVPGSGAVLDPSGRSTP